MKIKKTIFAEGNLRCRVIIFIALILPLAFFSCATVASEFGQFAPGIGQLASQSLQALGISPQIADAIGKSGVNLAAEWANAEFEELAPEHEYFLGRAVAANILTRYSLQTNMPAFTDYLNQICNALVINSPRPEIFSGYHVAILDSNEINAFATPGGHIFLTRGLIESAASEDTLAAVIAHEIAHVQLKHGLATIKSSRVNQAFAQAILDVGTAASGRDLAAITEAFGLSVDVVVNTMLNGYSREQEFQADSVAMSFMSLAGYQPSALIDMLRALERNQPNSGGGFNNTHPTPAQRISSAEQTVGNFDGPDTRSHRVSRFSSAR